MVPKSNESEDRQAPTEGQDPLHQAWEWFSEHGEQYVRPALIGLVVLIGGLLLYRSYRNKYAAERVQTWQQISELPPLPSSLMRQENPEAAREKIIRQCRQILSERWNTRATPWVLLKLGNAQLAAQEYQDEIGRASCRQRVCVGV
mgnify:CR=1 FL=1